MPKAPLDNYLKTYRRRAGLTQDELALLLGALHGTKVSRYERGGRVPSLETALAYEAVLGIPVSRLFRGKFRKVETELAKRVQAAGERLSPRARALLATRALTPSTEA